MTTKPQADITETNDTTEAISAEVATQLKAAQDLERAEARQDLEEAFWLAGIEAFSAITNALTPKPEITLTTQPNEAELKATRFQAEREKLAAQKRKVA